jgi:isopenicillin N synthase-like dioxygenase
MTVRPTGARHQTVPVIDLDTDDAAGVARQIREASVEVGFYVLTGHAIPQRVFDEAFAAARAFYALPEPVKLQYEMDRSQTGYLPSGRSVIKASTIADNRKEDVTEIYLLRNDLRRFHPDLIAGRRFRGRNRWPAELPAFRPALLSYMLHMEHLARSLMPCYETALGLARGALAPFFEEAQLSVSVAHYPVSDASDSGRYGLAPHTDAGFLTFIPMQAEPGLEIRDAAGNWFAPPVVEGGILVNTGDMLARWTNDAFLSTPHRVMVMRDRARTSLPFFFYPALDAVIDPRFMSADPPRHAPIRFEDYFSWYVSRNYAHQAEPESAP